MINKPINLSPYNTCVATDEDIHIKYEIPNAKIDGCVALVNELDSGNCVLIHRENFDESTNQVDLNIGQSLLQEVLAESQEIVLTEEGNFDFLFNEDLCLNIGDVVDVEINNSGTITTQSLTLYNAPVTFDNISAGDWQIKNDIMPSGLVITPNVEYASGATITIIVNHDNKDEYSWNSFYWQTPTKETNVRAVTGVDPSSNKIFLQPTVEDYSTITPEYNISDDSTSDFTSALIVSNYNSYSNWMYTSSDLHASDENTDTSSYCYKGQLTDYIGKPMFASSGGFHDKVMAIGLGKCVIEIYDYDNALITQARILAYDKFTGDSSSTSIGSCYGYIIDNEKFPTQMNSRTELIRWRPNNSYRFYNYNYAKLYSVDDINNQDDIGDLILYENNYYMIKNQSFADYSYVASVYPSIPDNMQIGDTIDMWSHDEAEFNISPSCYFRYKTKPKASLYNASGIPIQDGKFNDINCKFGVYFYNASINYFYLYLYVWKPESFSWEFLERSPMLHDSDTYDFTGLVHSRRYKVNATVMDIDGDEWNSQDMIFTINNPFVDVSDISAVFNKNATTIDISLNKFLEQYDLATFEFYKVAQTDRSDTTRLLYAGGGIAKMPGNVIYNKWSDYNICNDTYYDYYARMMYKTLDGDSGLQWLRVATGVHTDFEGSSILGLEKVGDSKLSISNSFTILYQFESKMGELNNELSREYLNSFGKYPKELKGHQNYITGSLSGLLGSECKGIYEEPNGIRKDWNNFVDDDTIKLYRGLDGETMIISIDTNRVKPYYFPCVGIVNEVSITFKEIASASKYAIFSTTVGV